MTRSLHLDDVGKRYVKYEDMPLLLSRALRMRAAHKRTHLWAVRHVNLDVEQAETVGVLGRNGSGKSTLLRMLAGVTAPTEGAVSVAGRISPLISVGVGFHTELTGRENVYVNGLVLGLGRAEIDRLFDQIVDFSEVEHFIDTPVKFYSSGMLVRLGFSVAVAARPDVLLVDEVLAVGDLAFQGKCFDRMEEMKTQGTSILVVSHNLNAIRRMCSRVLVLHDGLAKYSGPTNEGISVYFDLLGTDAAGPGELGWSGRRKGQGDPRAIVEIADAGIYDDAGLRTAHLQAGGEASVRFRARFHQAVPDAYFGISFQTETGVAVYSDSSWRNGARSYEAGDEVACEIRFPVNLVTGSYSVRAGVRWGVGRGSMTSVAKLPFFVSGRNVKGVVDLGATFEVADGAGVPAGPAHPDGGIADTSGAERAGAGGDLAGGNAV